MQQTQTYKLNKPEMSDPFSPAPLNENADKLEGALSALTARTVTLENCRIVVGTYTGNNATGGQIIDLGGRPLGVLVSNEKFFSPYISFVTGDIVAVCDYAEGMKITENGFWVNNMVNIDRRKFAFIAFLGDWTEAHLPKST